MNPDVRRAIALNRDERRLTAALEVHEARRFDSDAARAVRDRVEDLLETVRAVVGDDDFWQRLKDQAARPLTAKQIDRLRAVDAPAFAALLEAAGYTCPPKPPADELVDETLAAVARALGEPHPPGLLSRWRTGRATGDDPQSEAIEEARDYLMTLHYRVRRQVEHESVPLEFENHSLRTAARSLGAGARWIIPKAVGVAGGALVEMFAPGFGAGIVLTKTVSKVAEDGLDLATRSILGSTLAESLDPPLPVTRELSDSIDYSPVNVHVALLTESLGRLRSYSSHGYPELGIYQETVRRGFRHLQRLEELCTDQGLSDWEKAHSIEPFRRALNEHAAREREIYNAAESMPEGEAASFLHDRLAERLNYPFGR